MSRLPFEIHTDLRTARKTRRGSTMRPEDVPTGISKEYARLPRIPLTEPVSGLSLREVLDRRQSKRDVNDASLTMADVSELFGLALRQKVDSARRPYPSGGALYPIETYFIGPIDNEPARIYHYLPNAHALEVLWGVPIDEPVGNIFGEEQKEAKAALLLTARWHRSSAKYGDFSYVLGLLEAGHIGQNLVLAATAGDLKACPMGGFDDEKVASLLDLDPNEEQPVHAIMIGK